MGNVKLNINESSLRNPSMSGGGGIITDVNGELVAAFYRQYRIRSNSEAEAFALVNGLNLCKQLHPYEVEVKSDSKLICSRWQNDSEVISPMRDAWDQGKSFATQMVIHVHHAYSEVNQVVDGLAKIGAQEQPIDLLEIQDLPCEVKGLLRLGKLGLPYLHCR
ncbi:hypothetical protein F2P56_013094 [Juglans regia]|uniref:RNase H type-1 domain-containing protein n=2 Tax=Juglans regia TaxID=51240 RepID=A0A833XNE4_JUGRE|nr:uncharacterized protein LOC109005608 [Juglans regia]KAF5468989.1 hypothetical protein F2P56_013094 [Juglans regia]